MSARDENTRSESRPTGIGPGERLQAARIQQGLSLDDVANRMHLSADIVEAIENNNFDVITAPIFVKGYLRAYARIVLLDEDDMIQQYIAYYSEEDPPITSTSNMAPELSVADARIKWTTYLVVLVLAALLAVWWWNKEQNQDPTISLDTQAPAGDSAINVESGVVNSEIEAVSEAIAEPATVTPQASTTPEMQPVETAEPAVTVEAESTPAMEESVSEPVASTTEAAAAEPPTATEAAAVEPPIATEATAVEPPTATGIVANQIAPSGTDKLEIIVHADSWADIKDGTDFQMVYDLLRANETLELIGEAPFKVFLGNAHGVEMRINGEDVNLAPRIRDNNTARLRIGG